MQVVNNLQLEEKQYTRETVRDWKTEWEDTNGTTDELETDAGTGSSRAVRVPGYAFVKLEEIEKCSRPLPTKDGYVQMVYRD